MTAARVAPELAGEYRRLCLQLAAQEPDLQRRQELEQLASILSRVPREPAHTFWEALQSLWLTHMLVMSDENYPGPGVSFGRIDQTCIPR
jgi:formate C-acetyltransferase